MGGAFKLPSGFEISGGTAQGQMVTPFSQPGLGSRAGATSQVYGAGSIAVCGAQVKTGQFRQR